MISRTKKQLSKHELDNLVYRAFDKQVSIKEFVELTDGWYNIAYYIMLNNGQEVILKVAPPPDVPILTYETGLMETEVAVFNLIKQRTEIPVPNILFCDFSQEIINRDYYFMEKLQGKPWNLIKDSLSQAQNDQIWYDLGKYCGLINKIEASEFGYYRLFPEISSSSWEKTFPKMVEVLLNDGIKLKAQLPISNNMIQELIDSYKTELAKIQTPRLVHWDLWEGNVFIKPNSDSYHIEGIIDTERAHYADPVMEVGFNVAMMNNQNNHPFLKGISEETGVNEYKEIKNFQTRRQLYNIYLSLIMLIESKSRQYRGSEAENILKWAKDSLIDAYQYLNKAIN